MSIRKYKHILCSLVASGLFLVGLCLLLNGTSQTAWADSGELFVTPAGSGDCSQANPCDLQTALSTVSNGDTLYVAGGTYTGSGGAVITVTHSITLYGGWDGTTTMPVVRDPTTYPTTLDGEATRRGVHISGEITPTVAGFIITGGRAEDGGGIYVYDASPRIQNNVITANRTIDGGAYADGRGGGIYVGGNSAASITQNRILSNTSGYGGGIYHDGGGSITVITNEIAGNSVLHRGGGIMVERSPDLIQANVIAGNTAAADGGGLLIWAAAPQVAGNRIVGNVANSGGGIGMGNNATPNLLNNMLIGNSRDGLLMISSSPMVINNTIVGSGLSSSGAGLNLRSSPGCTPPYCTTGVYVNNIIVSYTVGIYGTGPITPMIDYNDVWGNSTADYTLPVDVVIGTHNISQDPRFTNPAADAYQLQSISPCIDAGDPAGVPPAPPTDINGNRRPVGARVDIGAEEFAIEIYLPLVVRNDH